MRSLGLRLFLCLAVAWARADQVVDAWAFFQKDVRFYAVERESDATGDTAGEAAVDAVGEADVEAEGFAAVQAEGLAQAESQAQGVVVESEAESEGESDRASPCNRQARHPVQAALMRMRSGVPPGETMGLQFSPDFIGDLMSNMSIADMMTFSKQMLEAVRNDNFVDLFYEGIHMVSLAVTDFLDSSRVRVRELDAESRNASSSNEVLLLMKGFFEREGAAVANMSGVLSQALQAFVGNFPASNSFVRMPSFSGNFSIFELVNGFFEDYYSDVFHTNTSAAFCDRIFSIVDNMTSMDLEISQEYLPMLRNSAPTPLQTTTLIKSLASDVVPRVNRMMNTTLDVGMTLTSSFQSALQLEMETITRVAQERLRCSFTGSGIRAGPGLLLLVLSHAASWLFAARRW